MPMSFHHPCRFAVTVHRVQGATLEGDVHVLLNAEFFADGQAVSCALPLRGA
jgi:hypothetical protein